MNFQQKKKHIEGQNAIAIVTAPFTCGGSGKSLANVRKSVYAPGASSDAGAAGGGAWPGARKCFARTVTRYCVLGDKPVPMKMSIIRKL